MPEVTTLALDRQAGLAVKLKAELRKARRTAVQLGWLTEGLYWSSVLAGGVAAGLGLLGSARFGWPNGTLEPYISVLAGLSTGLVVIIKQLRLRAKTAIWFDFMALIDTLGTRLMFETTPTVEEVAAVAEDFRKARLRVQEEMKSADADSDQHRSSA